MNELNVKSARKLLFWYLGIIKRRAKNQALFIITFIGNLLIKVNSVCFIHKGDESSILLFSLKNNRPDIRQMLDNAASTMDNRYDELKVVNKVTVCLRHWNDAIKIALHVRKYWHGYYNGMIEYLLIVKIMLNIIDIRRDADKISNWEKYRLVVFYYDANIVCNYFSQYFQSLGIKTVTLQHGVMIAHRPEIKNKIDYAGLEFGGFVSDYFLVWNEFTKQEAVKDGIAVEKIKVLGNIKCLNITPLPNEKTGYFGVILDGSDNEENNIPMLKIAREIAMTYKMMYEVRYHPNFKFTEYDKYISNEGRVCARNVSLSDYLKGVEFCILSNSTCFFELPYYSKKCFRYSSLSKTDKFKDLDIPTFTDFESFQSLFNSSTDNAENTPAKDWELYHEFFMGFVH